MFAEEWKLTNKEIEIITEQGDDIALAQEGKKRAYIEAGGVILNPDALPDLYKALKQLLRASESDGKRQHHNLCYGIDIEPHPDCELCKLTPIERQARDALAKAGGIK